MDYLKEGYKQLSEPRFYTKLESCPTEQFRREIQDQVEDMYQNGEIDESVKSYLTDHTCRTSQLYLLPKIHKNSEKPPGRPIISANGSPTEKISQFVDHFLNPRISTLKSYVKDTTHFLNILEDLGELPPDCLLATLDIVSLYTNINNDIGIRAARQTLNRTRPERFVKPTNETRIKLLEMVLTKNNFQFNGQNYLQVGGTCMGTKLAPGYACNTVGDFESTFVYTYDKQPLLFVRFIDDIFLIWQHGRASLEEFIHYLNTRTDNFKFTQEISEYQVSFLDTVVKLSNNKIITDLYSKPTDSHNYLRYESAHPQRCKDSIPYSQFLRIRRICSELNSYDAHILSLTPYFLKQNYPIELLKEAAILARSQDRKALLTPKPDTEDKGEDQIFLITRYHPHDHFLRNMIYNNWDMLGKSPTTDHLHQKHLMCGYKRPKNLRDLLVKAKVSPKPGDTEADPTHVEVTAIPAETPSPATTGGTKQKSITDFFHKVTGRLSKMVRKNSPTKPAPAPKPLTKPPREGTSRQERGFLFCNRTDCRYCPLLNKSGSIYCPITDSTHECMKKISYRSSNLIYAITCKRCGIQYVGQTLLRIKDRFVHHFRDIEVADKEKSVGKHFSQDNHNGIKDVQISVLEFIKKPPRSPQAAVIRNRVEKRWTHLLRCLAPQGLNIENPKEYKTKK